MADPGLDSIGELTLPNLGPFPVSGTPAWTTFWNDIYGGTNTMDAWWLDRMTLAHYPLTERMTWFWHGHFATAISKVIYPLPMLVQNKSQRSLALGDFRDLAKAMVLDGALNFWLDNEDNYSFAPNENLAREFMELFTLGVGTLPRTTLPPQPRPSRGIRPCYGRRGHLRSQGSLLRARQHSWHHCSTGWTGFRRTRRIAAPERQVHHRPTVVSLRLVDDHATRRF